MLAYAYIRLKNVHSQSVYGPQQTHNEARMLARG